MGEAEDFPMQLENPVEPVAVAAGEGQPVGEAEGPRAAAVEAGLHLHSERAEQVRAVGRWSVVEALRVAWEASQKAQVGEQLHW